MSINTQIDIVGEEITEHLVEIAKLFKEGYELTFIAHHPDHDNREVIIKNHENISGLFSLLQSYESGEGIPEKSPQSLRSSMTDIESKLAAPETLQEYYDSKTDDQLEALKLLWLAEVTYESPEILYKDDDPKLMQTLDMNDTFGAALVMSKYVPDDELLEVARLFQRYGECGLIYWVSEKNNQMTSGFPAINRYIEFVRNEEKVRSETENLSQWAYKKVSYFIGG